MFFESSVRTAAALLALWVVGLSSSASAAEITVKTVKASSTLPEAEGARYLPEYAADNQVGTFWVEGEEAAGLGEWIQFDFEATQTIERIEIRPGNWYSSDFWARHNRIKEVQLKFQTGAPLRQTFEDKQEVQIIKLDAPVKTRFVRIILKAVYPGTTFNDTCLSEVRFFGPGETPGVVQPKVATASSVYPGYAAADAIDGMRDTLWCERSDGDGVGDWLELTLPAETEIKGVRLLNGTGAAESAFMSNNRVAQIKISTQGAEVSAPLTDKFGEYQDVLFPAPVRGVSVKLTIEKVNRGLKFNDTCLAEVQVLK